MSAYKEIPAKAPQRLSPIWFLVITFLLFATTLTALAVIEAGRAQSHAGGESDLLILTRMWNHFRAGAENDTETATVERIARDAGNATNPSASAAQQGRNFYEEQQAVVVNAESMDSPVMGQRQDAYGPPQSREDSYEQDPYYDVADDYGPGRYPSAESRPESEEEEHFYDKEDTGEGRAHQARPYDSFYAPWSHTQQPAPVATHPAAEGNNRKLQAPSAPNRSPYPAYDEVYDYPMGFQPRPHPKTELAKQSQPASDNAVIQVQSESTLVTVLKSLKQIWDLYQALMSAWNAVSERHQESTEKFRQEQAAKKAEKEQLRQQQQKTRINSKKPPRMEGNKKNQNKKPPTTTTKSSTKSTTTAAPEVSDEEEDAKEQPQKTVEKVETVTPSATDTKVSALKGEKGNLRSVRGLRQRRDAEAEEKADTDVGEGRYIKGDPLKGYYDFVITEGSYKFWAVFQVGTALLIIYSTFAAIYYSKVNPLTSDYDYTDYLGGVRSLSGGDADFVDDGDAATPPVSTTSRIMEWLPRTAHSIQFILDAIDKVPVDHDKDKELGWSAAKTDTPAVGMR